MNKARYAELMRDGGPLTGPEVLKGWHFCPDWDYLLIGLKMPEKESCTCRSLDDLDWEAGLRSAATRSSLPLSLSRTIPLALAELDRLRAEVEGLKGELEIIHAGEDL